MCLCHVILGFFFFFFNHLFCCSILTILEKNFLYFSLFTFCICVCHVIQSSIIRYRVWFLQHLAHYKYIKLININFLETFFLESFNVWHSLLISALYHQIKTPISFWYRRGLNPRSLIQPSEHMLRPNITELVSF